MTSTKHWLRYCPECHSEVWSIQTRGQCQECKTTFLADKDGNVIPNSFRITRDNKIWGRIISESCDPDVPRSWKVCAYENPIEYYLIGNNPIEFDQFYDCIHGYLKDAKSN